MVAPWRALLFSLAMGLLLAGAARAQDWEGAPVVADPTASMTRSGATPTGMAYAVAPAAVPSSGSTGRVVLPNPAAQAPGSLFPATPEPPMPAPQPPSLSSELQSRAPQPPSLVPPPGAALATCGEDGPAIQCDGAGCYCTPLWTFRADAVFLTRSAPPGKVLIADPRVGTLLDAGQFDPGTAAGWDISVIRRRVFGDWGVEGLYFDDSGWSSSNTFTAAGPGIVQFATPLAVGGASTFTSAYASRLRNVEVNGRYERTDWLDYIVGFRYLDLGESLDITQSAIGGLPPGSTASYAIASHNHLAGFQIGLDAHFWDCRRFSLDGTLKAGIFGNDATNSALATVPGAGLASAASKSGVAGLTELDFTGTYHINDCWAVRGGYQLLWVEGAALATNQLAVSNPLTGTAAVDTNATAFYHGAFVGLEFRR